MLSDPSGRHSSQWEKLSDNALATFRPQLATAWRFMIQVLEESERRSGRNKTLFDISIQDRGRKRAS